MCGTGHTKDGWANMSLCSLWTCVRIQALLPEAWVSQTSRPPGYRSLGWRQWRW